MQTLGASLAPNLPMRWFKSDGVFTQYVGLWATWWLNGENQTAKVIFVTVVGGTTAPSTHDTSVSLGTLFPWVVVQLQCVGEESPVWEAIRQTLAADFQPPQPQPPATSSQSRRANHDPSQDTHATRAVHAPEPLAALELKQAAHGDAALPRPARVLDRRRVEYHMPAVPTVRVFVEKKAHRNPMQEKLEADAGLARSGSVLGAINEWHTWFVADKPE